MEMSTTPRWKRKRCLALSGMILTAFAVGILISPGVWSVASGLTATVSSSLAKDTKCKLGGTPTGPAYDPATHEIYVPNEFSSEVSVVKSPCTVAATIKLPSGSEPQAAAFDPANNYVYVVGYDSSQVYVISGTTIVTTLGGFVGPDALVYDPCLNGMLVANFAGANLTLVTSSLHVRGNVPVGTAPDGIDYDPYTGAVNVANFNDGNSTIIDACTLTSFGYYTTGTGPSGVAYDVECGCDLVPNFVSDTVTVLGSGTPITGFDGPTSATWSQAKLAVYVTNDDSGTVWALGGATGRTIVQEITLAVGIDASAYDAANNDLYVTDSSTGMLYVIST